MGFLWVHPCLGLGWLCSEWPPLNYFCYFKSYYIDFNSYPLLHTNNMSTILYQLSYIKIIFTYIVFFCCCCCFCWFVIALKADIQYTYVQIYYSSRAYKYKNCTYWKRTDHQPLQSSSMLSSFTVQQNSFHYKFSYMEFTVSITFFFTQTNSVNSGSYWGWVIFELLTFVDFGVRDLSYSTPFWVQ